jgi:hypothetical protein
MKILRIITDFVLCQLSLVNRLQSSAPLNATEEERHECVGSSETFTDIAYTFSFQTTLCSAVPTEPYQGPVTWSCEHDNGLSGSIDDGGYFDQLSDHVRLKKDSAPLSATNIGVKSGVAVN